jgi:hypothetical protein
MALIDIGSQKQLFADDYLIESLSSTRQVVNPAEKVEHNPVVRQDRPWEGNHVGAKTIFFDAEEQRFKMWYTTYWYRVRREGDDIVVDERFDEYAAQRLCLATSNDGVHWEKPELGLVEFDGSKRNNILPETCLAPRDFGSAYRDSHLIYDLHDSAERRYKLVMTVYDDENPGMKLYLFYSPDGFDWTPHAEAPVVDYAPRRGRWGPMYFMGWDPIRRCYAVHMENNQHFRGPLGKRVVGRAESADFVEWSEGETILVPDAADAPDTQFYSMPCIAYEGLYVGLLWNFRVTNLTHHPQLVFSRDGIHYERKYLDPFIVRGSRGEFDCHNMYAHAPLVYGDRILTYYNGTNHRSDVQTLELGDKTTMAVGLALTPLDGFVSLDGVTGHPPNYEPYPRDIAPYSKAATRGFRFSGSCLLLNMRAALQYSSAGPCEVRVEILGANHRRLEGYTFDDADPLTSTNPAQVATWKGAADLSALQGKTVRLRFWFKNAKLYSFQFR